MSLNEAPLHDFEESALQLRQEVYSLGDPAPLLLESAELHPLQEPVAALDHPLQSSEKLVPMLVYEVRFQLREKLVLKLRALSEDIQNVVQLQLLVAALVQLPL